MHYYQFNIGDYTSHTNHLDPLEDLAFRRMIDWCYLHELPLPLDVDEISRKISLRDNKEEISYVLKEFFTETSDGFVNHRIEREVLAFKAKSDKARKSAEARWKKTKPQSEVNANALETQSESNAKQETLTNNQEPLTNNQDKEPSSANANDPFDVFCYWKKVMKKNDSAKLTPKRLKAVKARLKEGYTVDQIKQAIFGCSVTPHNMGRNDQQKRFDCLELICRSGENIERFAGNAQQAAPQQYSAITNKNINTIQDLELK